MPPLVSVIVPNYNHEPFLKQRLESIFNQSFQDFEVIILDDASTDGSLEILASYTNHHKVSHFVVNEKNTGSPFQQWKKGIELAQGKYIWIAESDDYCDNNFLKRLVEKIDDHTGLCYSQTIDVNVKGEEILHRIDYTKEFEPNIWESDFRISGIGFIKQYLLIKNVVPNASGVLFKRSLVNDNFFTPRLLEMRMCGDWFFWVKICEHGDVQFIHQPLNFFRDHSASTRNHSTLEKKKQRLLEEMTIRNYTHQTLGFRNKKKEEELESRWFKLHRFTSAFSNHFLNFNQNSKTKFIFRFLYYKITNYRHA